MTDTALIGDRFLDVKFILSDRSIGDRGLRKEVARGAFPRPDANIGGRNFWRASTYARWKEEALAGKFARKTFFGKTRVTEQHPA